jgi:hypothetical protein
MSTRTDHEYFKWLISQIDIRNRNTYNDLFERMYDLEFVWTVPNDDNRVQDARELRDEFLNGTRSNLQVRPVSILEVLIALSRRVAWITSDPAELWAWRLIQNLRLNKASDPLVGGKAEKVEDALHALVWRTYRQDGQGGFFPLKEPHEDQTQKEVWDQMSAYVNEMVD